MIRRPQRRRVLSRIEIVFADAIDERDHPVDRHALVLRQPCQAGNVDRDLPEFLPAPEELDQIARWLGRGAHRSCVVVFGSRTHAFSASTGLAFASREESVKSLGGKTRPVYSRVHSWRSGKSMGKLSIEISLFGACIVRAAIPGGFEITGSKHKALFALLATAPMGRRTRSFLQETLWGTACYDTGRQSLRRALSDLRQVMGKGFDELLAATNSDLTLDLSRVSFIGRPGAGPFLEGLDIKERGFAAWLAGMRADPAQIYSLYSLSPRSRASLIQPVVAVLPFRGISPEHAILGDWIADGICRSLSLSNLLAVISHLSSRALSSGTTDLAQVRSELAADYCVAGSLRPDGGALVLDADFIEVISGRILWTRRFRGSLHHFLGAPGIGIAEIVAMVGRSIADDAMVHASDRSISDLEDHRLLLAGVGLMHRPALRDFARSRELIEETLRRAPRAAEAHAWRGKWHVLSVFNGWSVDPAKDTSVAIDCTARALDIDPDSAFCMTIDGFAHNNLLRRMDVAETRYDAAIERNPNESLSWLLRGALHAFNDEADEAVAAADQARLLSPIDPFRYYYDSLSATAYLAGGHYAQALEFAEQSLARHDRHNSTLRAKITALHHLGNGDAARAAGSELMRRQPGFTVEDYLRGHPAGGNKLGHRVAEALRAAGVP